VLRCGSAVARLLGLRVRIPPGEWMSVSCECCVLSGTGQLEPILGARSLCWDTATVYSFSANIRIKLQFFLLYGLCATRQTVPQNAICSFWSSLVDH
jgi:hypothetical protein